MKIQLLSAAFAVCALSLGACSQTADTPASVAVTDAWCRPTPPAAPVAGCYLTLTASGADRLVSVESPAAERTEIHSMSMENGVMHMAKLEDGLDLPAGTAVVTSSMRRGSIEATLLAAINVYDLSAARKGAAARPRPSSEKKSPKPMPRIG